MSEASKGSSDFFAMRLELDERKSSQSRSLRDINANVNFVIFDDQRTLQRVDTSCYYTDSGAVKSYRTLREPCNILQKQVSRRFTRECG